MRTAIDGGHAEKLENKLLKKKKERERNSTKGKLLSPRGQDIDQEIKRAFLPEEERKIH